MPLLYACTKVPLGSYQSNHPKLYTARRSTPLKGVRRIAEGSRLGGTKGCNSPGQSVAGGVRQTSLRDLG